MAASRAVSRRSPGVRSSSVIASTPTGISTRNVNGPGQLAMPRFGWELTIHVHSTSASAEVPTAVPPTARPAANVVNTTRITAAGTRSGKPAVGLMPATRRAAASTACSSGNT